MKRHIMHFIFALMPLLLFSCGQGPQFDSAVIKQQIMEVLTEQQRAWNTGSTEEFMQGYIKSDSLRFASGGNIYYGWDAMLGRYNTSYPDKVAMGVLAFSDLDIKVLSHDAALVFGKYMLQREADNPWGWFTLLFRKTDQGWRIVHDHTSTGE